MNDKITDKERLKSMNDKIADRFRVLIDKNGMEYVQPCHIGRKFDLSRASVHRILTKMKADPKYRRSFISLTYRLSLVNLEDFRRFLHEQDGKYLREVKA